MSDSIELIDKAIHGKCFLRDYLQISILILSYFKRID